MVLKFINHRQSCMSFKEYALRFTQLFKYVQSIVTDLRLRTGKFVTGVSDIVVKEYHTTMLVHDIDTSHHLVHVQQIE